MKWFLKNTETPDTTSYMVTYHPLLNLSFKNICKGVVLMLPQKQCECSCFLQYTRISPVGTVPSSKKGEGGNLALRLVNIGKWNTKWVIFPETSRFSLHSLFLFFTKKWKKAPRKWDRNEKERNGEDSFVCGMWIYESHKMLFCFS